MTGSTSTVEINVPDAIAVKSTETVLDNDFPTYVCITGVKRTHCGSLMSALEKARRNP